MIFNLFRYFSLRYLLMHPFRSFLTFLGVALGISLFLSIQLLNDATKRSLNENIDSMTGKADLTITADGMGFEDTVLSKITVIPGIKNVIPLIINHAYMSKPTNALDKKPLVFLGVDLLKDTAVREYNTEGGDIVPDPLAFVNQADSVIVTKSWARRHSKGMDDQIQLLTKEGLKDFTIRGLIDEIGPAKVYEGNLAIMDIDGARYNFGRDGLYDRIDLILNQERQLEDVRRDLKQALGSRFKIEDKKEQSESMQELVKSIQEITGLLGIISFMVGFLIIVNTVNTAISQRRKDIGSLRTFGAGTSHIITLFAGEFVTLALLSSLFGCWLGQEFAEYSAQRVASGLNSSLMTNINSMRIILTEKHILGALFLGLFSSVAALIYPLYKALQIHPIEAIKPQAVDFTLERKPRYIMIMGAVGIIFFGATIVATAISGNFEAMQGKDLQPSFLLTGILGIILIGPYLILTLLSVLQLLPWPFLLKFGFANLLKNPARTASTSVHLSLGFSLVLIVSGINISFMRTIVSWAEKITSSPNVVNVTSWGSIAGYQVQPLHESLREKLLKLPNIDMTLPNPVTGVRVVPVNIQGQRYMIKAYDNPGPQDPFMYLDGIDESAKVLATKLFDPNVETMLISEPMLKHFKARVGDTFEIETPGGKARLQIGGLIRDFASPNGVFYLSRDVYKKYWKDSLVTLFGVHHTPNLRTEDYIDQIAPMLNERDHLQAELPSVIARDVAKNLNDNMAMSDSTKWIALMIGTLGLLNSYLIGLLQRYRELGCIRSIGMTKEQLIGMVLSESVALGLTGIFVAFLLTIPLCFFWVNKTLTYLLGWKVEFFMESSDFLILFVTGLGVSVIAGIFPAMRAARLKLREALEYE